MGKRWMKMLGEELDHRLPKLIEVELSPQEVK